jgi:hypothetical protein
MPGAWTVPADVFAGGSAASVGPFAMMPTPGFTGRMPKTETQACMFLRSQSGKSMFMIEIQAGIKYDERSDTEFLS